MRGTFFSTKQFGVGHLVGAAGLAFGTAAMAKFLISLHEERVAAEKARLHAAAAQARAQIAAVRGYYG